MDSDSRVSFFHGSSIKHTQQHGVGRHCSTHPSRGFRSRVLVTGTLECPLFYSVDANLFLAHLFNHHGPALSLPLSLPTKFSTAPSSELHPTPCKFWQTFTCFSPFSQPLDHLRKAQTCLISAKPPQPSVSPKPGPESEAGCCLLWDLLQARPAIFLHPPPSPTPLYAQR